MERVGASSYIAREQGIFLTVNDTADIMSDYLNHYVENNIEALPQETMEQLRELIGFATAYATFMSKNAVYGWNIMIPGTATRLFCSVDMNDMSFVARAYQYEVKEKEKMRLVLEMYDSWRKTSNTSMVAAEDNSSTVLELINMFLQQSVQINAAFWRHAHLFFLLKGMPHTPRKTFVEYQKKIKSTPLPDVYEPLNTYLFRFACGCDAARIKSMISNLTTDDIEYLFNDNDTISAECPRCGKKFPFLRTDFKLP